MFLHSCLEFLQIFQVYLFDLHINGDFTVYQALLDYLDLLDRREIEVLMEHLDCLELQDYEEKQAW
jgi:hypothetical protein